MIVPEHQKAVREAQARLRDEVARLRSQVERLRGALERIANHEYRSDRRGRGMVDVSEVQGLMRAARSALAETGGA